MAKILDVTPISVTRIRRSNRIEILYTADGAIDRVIAHRVAAAQQGGVDLIPAVSVGPTTFLAAVIPAAVNTQLLALAALIDTSDTAPA